MSRRAILFDLDGVLVDSEPYHHRAFDEALAEAGSPPVPFADYAREFSSGGRGRAWFAANRPTLEYETIHARKQEIFEGLLRSDVGLRDGAALAVIRLAKHWPLAVVTNSWGAHVRLVLERFELAPRFDVVVAREDYERPKPAPDAFLVAAKRLGLPPGACLVIEDAEKGARAAQAAGIPFVAVPNAYTAGSDFAGAERVFGSLEELTESLLATVDAAS